MELESERFVSPLFSLTSDFLGQNPSEGREEIDVLLKEIFMSVVEGGRTIPLAPGLSL